MQTASTPHEMYLRNVATTSTGARVDLKITNATAYKASDSTKNGLTITRDMAEINLFGPTTGQPTNTWNADFTGYGNGESPVS